MGKLKVGSLCYTDIVEQAKKGHSAFSRGKNGKVYFNIAIWENEEADKFGNSTSIQLNSVKEKREAEGKIFIGNAKELGAKTENVKPQTDNNIPSYSDDLPF